MALALVLSGNTSTADDPSRLTIGTVTEEIDRSNRGCSLQLPRGFANREGNFVLVSDFEVTSHLSPLGGCGIGSGNRSAY
jgi:hypothetical protein